MGSKSSPPPAPDYVGAAQAQGVANTEAARAGAKLSNPNVISPYGTQTVQYGTPQFDQSGYDQALAAYNTGTAPTSGSYGLQDFLGYNQRAAPSGYTDYAKDADLQYQNYLNSAYGDDSAVASQFGFTAPTPTRQGQAPTREQFTTYGGDLDVPTVTQELNPQSQQIFDAQQGTRLGLANLSGDALRTAQGVLNQPFQYNGPGIQTSLQQQGTIFGAPDYGRAQTSVSGGQIQGAPDLASYGQAGANVQRGQIQDAPQSTTLKNTFQGGGDINSGPQMGQYGFATGLAGDAFGRAGSISGNQYGQAGGGPAGDAYGRAGGISGGQYGLASGQLDLSNVAKMPINAGMTAQQAIMSRLAPQIERERQAQETQLRNQGLVAGGEAYGNAMTIQNQRENDLKTQAVLQGLGLDLTANQQGFNQALQQGQFGNQAIAQNFGQGYQGQEQQNRAIGQNFAQGQSATQLGNQAIGQNFGQGLQAQNQANQAIGQNFGQGLQGQQLTNQAIGQNYGQGVNLANTQNQAQAQRYGQNLGQAQFYNQAQGQQYQQQLAQQAAQNAAQQQGFGQNMNVAELQNQAIQQNQQAALAQQAAANQAQAQGFGQNLSAGQFYNQGQQQDYQNALSRMQAQNQAQNQNFNQGLASAQFGNTAQQQAYQQALYQRELPLNEISALMSGSQIQNPQFPSYSGSQVAPAPIFAGTQAGYNAALQGYGMENNANNAFMSGLFGLGGAALGAPSGGLLSKLIGR